MEKGQGWILSWGGKGSDRDPDIKSKQESDSVFVASYEIERTFSFREMGDF